MRIGIDYRSTQEFKQKFRGVGYYTRSLVKHLAEIDKKNQYLLYVNPAKPVERVTKHSNFSLTPSHFPWQYALKNRFLEWQITTSSDLKRERFNVFHFTFPQNVPWVRTTSFIATVHDLISLIFSEHYKHNKLRPIYDWLWTQSVRRAEAIIAVSENTKKDIVNYLGIPEEKIRVIYEAADPFFSPLTEEEVQPFKEELNLERYILYVGGMEPRKNLICLLRAIAQLPNEIKLVYKLVIAGQPDQFFNQLLETIKELDLEERIILVGFMSREKLVRLYNGAEVLVLPSLYEGFGLPILEAMACGTPVVCSDTASIPEVAGEAALYFSPEDVGQLSTSVAKVLTEPETAQRLREKGLRQAQKFSWRETAKKTLEVYKEVAG